MIASNTARAVLKSPLVLQTIVIAQMVSIGGKGATGIVQVNIRLNTGHLRDDLRSHHLPGTKTRFKSNQSATKLQHKTTKHKRRKQSNETNGRL